MPPCQDPAPPPPIRRAAALAAIKRFIEANLESESATVPGLCRRFGLSRASLYRLFAREGGIARYIQRRRLNRAFAMLASPAGPRARLIDLAVAFQFSSDNTFIRAFHRHFGLTPGAVRRLSGLSGPLQQIPP
ncbi:MAG TPA: helix-turn-helix domain-containing protein [Acetobacteraceae bacterium]|nr:helix-turn-helix domain-containing protein [Acetobacteraceae bacterium]